MIERAIFPKPLDIKQDVYRQNVRIGQTYFSFGLFEMFDNPDPSRLYRITRNAEGVVTFEIVEAPHA